ncbi:MAG: hypothetical protein U9Q21_02460 [Candidatus Auribacterota bacterium]|nr:hypothetical protein [Candidatus Auribacterota bacterium]
MRIKKVRNIGNGEKVKIDYESENSAGGFDIMSLECADAARPEFYDALHALIPQVIQTLELPADWKPRITVSGFTLSYDKSNTMSAVIVAKRELENSSSPHNLATPIKGQFFHDEDQPDIMSTDKHFDEEMEKKLITAMGEAVRYIQGNRAQRDLFEGGGE